MELGEATALAGRFITRAIFKVHRLPLHEHSQRAVMWWKNQNSNISVGKSLRERRKHLRLFSVHDGVDEAKQLSLHLTVSALTVDLDKGRCPALFGTLCSIYTSRPLTCRTVPMHYSRPSSDLGSYLARFVATADYLCNTSPDAPAVLEGDIICDMRIQEARRRAFELVEAERGWKRRLVVLMEDPVSARSAGLPTLANVLHNSEPGSATSVSMIAAWRAAKNLGTLSSRDFAEVCVKQRRLLRSAIARTQDRRSMLVLQGMLSEYESELANIARSLLGRISVRRLLKKLRAGLEEKRLGHGTKRLAG
jgi:Fe-S-cluster containining protein